MGRIGFIFLCLVGAPSCVAWASADPIINKETQGLDNRFNPAISVILNGRYGGFSQNESEILGFSVGEEGERGSRGFALDESELNFSANIDDKFYGSLTAALVREDGEDKVELEEAYIQTIPGLGLPRGLTLKAGRAFWTLGYLNEHHSHTDDFTDRPLPYRVFLNNNFNDDGVELNYVLPTPFYSELGGGVFRGDDFPGANGTGKSLFDNYSLFARVGGDFKENHNWRLGASHLTTRANERLSNEEHVAFRGKTDISIIDFRYEWLPCGNPMQSMLSFQGEYFWQHEQGDYADLHNPAIPRIATDFEGNANGWYAQAVYKFKPQWRVGARYTRLKPATMPAVLDHSDLNAMGYAPYVSSVMADWTPSEFSRLRLQYNYDRTVAGQTDHQLILQYIMSIGAHGAHKY